MSITTKIAVPADINMKDYSSLYNGIEGGYYRLANEIICLAADDYRKALKCLNGMGFTENQIFDNEWRREICTGKRYRGVNLDKIVRLVKELCEDELFFESKYYDNLTRVPGNEIVEGIKRQVFGEKFN